MEYLLKYLINGFDIDIKSFKSWEVEGKLQRENYWKHVYKKI